MSNFDYSVILHSCDQEFLQAECKRVGEICESLVRSIDSLQTSEAQDEVSLRIRACWAYVSIVSNRLRQLVKLASINPNT